MLRRFGCRASGWVLVDGSARLWGWHWVEASDERWATPNAALCSFVSDQAAREQLQAHGFRVDFDADGSQLGAYLVTEPRVGLPPLTAAPTDRPAEPILPDWEALLSLGAAALTVMRPLTKKAAQSGMRAWSRPSGGSAPIFGAPRCTRPL